jgi:hypothetical protein
VGSAWAVLIAERIHFISELAKGCRGGGTGEAGTDDDNLEFSFIGRIDQFEVLAMFIPFVRQ